MNRDKYYFLWSFLATLIFHSPNGFSQPGPGNALSFNGTTNRVTYDNLLNNLELPFTISHWVKVNEKGTSYNYVFVSCLTPNNWYNGFWNSVNLEAMGISYGDGKGALNPAYRRSKRYVFKEDIKNRWIHCAFVVRGPTDIDLYVNGENVGGVYSGSGEAEMAKGSVCETQIGFNKNNDGNHYFNGSLDELRIWNYARSADQIRTDMCRKLSGNEQGLLAYWNFDKGEGQTLQLNNRTELATIDGPATWSVSGAAIGDESFYDYSLSGTTDTIRFEDNSKTFNISTENPDTWIGYQVYKVNEPPNTSNGATLPFLNGYYGIYPVFSHAKIQTYNVDLTSMCDEGNYRLGNADPNWSELNSAGLYPTFNTVTNSEVVIDFSIDDLNVLYDREICPNESVTLNLESECVDSYLWSNGSESHEVTIEEPGYYWIQRTIRGQTFRRDFEVKAKPTTKDFFTKDVIEVCPNDFPLTLPINGDTISYDDVISSSDGISNGEVTNSGEFWVIFNDNCGLAQDTIRINIREKPGESIFSEDEIKLCTNDFPYELPVKTDILDEVVLLSSNDALKNGLIEKEGIYWIEYTDECFLRRDSIHVSLAEPIFKGLPNVFTPNNDHINDVFEMDPTLAGSLLEVYTRTGNLVFRTKNYQNNWDGGDLPSGTYYYLIAEQCSGRKIKGWITILR